MKSLLKKMSGDKKGFTLAELLVVVAIIGILVAISIPVFTAQLGKARQATNNANLRAAKAAAVAAYLTEESSGSVTYSYNINDGTATKKTDDVPSGLSELTINSESIKKDGVYSSIYVTVDASTNVKLYAQ